MPGALRHSGFDLLENRALTAPLIFRRPVGFPDPPDVNNATALNDVEEANDGTVNASGMATGGNLALSVQTVTETVDFLQSNDPNPLVGNYETSFSASTMVGVTDNGGGFVGGGGGSLIRRDYRLADNAGPTAQGYVRETYTFGIHATPGFGIPTGSGGLTAPGLNVATTLGGVTITVNNSPTQLPAGQSSSGTITSGADIVQYSADTSIYGNITVHVVRIRNVGSLPEATRLTNGDVGGIPWQVTMTEGVGGAFAGAATYSVSSSYSLEVFDSPENIGIPIS